MHHSFLSPALSLSHCFPHSHQKVDSDCDTRQLCMCCMEYIPKSTFYDHHHKMREKQEAARLVLAASLEIQEGMVEGKRGRRDEKVGRREIRGKTAFSLTHPHTHSHPHTNTHILSHTLSLDPLAEDILKYFLPVEAASAHSAPAAIATLVRVFAFLLSILFPPHTHSFFPAFSPYLSQLLLLTHCDCYFPAFSSFLHGSANTSCD